jgi:hypothetical protein
VLVGDVVFVDLLIIVLIVAACVLVWGVLSFLGRIRCGLPSLPKKGKSFYGGRGKDLDVHVLMTVLMCDDVC